MSRTSSRAGGAGESAVGFVDERLGAARGVKFLMSYVFPDHWSFLLGEIALYSFIVLIATGTYLALFFDPSTTQSVYHGGYAALQGQEVSAAYASTLHLSFAVSGGLLMRQTHHWAALVFVAAITLHLLRIIFTGAFRKPREHQLPDRPDAARARDPRGLRRLLAARRPALRDGPRDRLGGGDVAAADRRPVRLRPVGWALPRLDAPSSPVCTSRTCSSSRRCSRG